MNVYSATIKTDINATPANFNVMAASFQVAVQKILNKYPNGIIMQMYTLAEGGNVIQ